MYPQGFIFFIITTFSPFDKFCPRFHKYFTCLSLGQGSLRHKKALHPMVRMQRLSV